MIFGPGLAASGNTVTVGSAVNRLMHRSHGRNKRRRALFAVAVDLQMRRLGQGRTPIVGLPPSSAALRFRKKQLRTHPEHLGLPLRTRGRGEGKMYPSRNRRTLGAV